MRGTGTPKVTDGPYAEARDVIGGPFIVEARDYDEAVALCQDCPHLDFGPIEIRGEIARVFLAQEAAIAQRLVRAKRLRRERDVPLDRRAPPISTRGSIPSSTR